MPIYEYQCNRCGNEFEEWQKFSDPVIDKCPSCGGKASRLISQSSFILKGSGWYVTDYGRGSSCQKPAPKETSKESPKETPKESTCATKTSSSDSKD
jgi:putative FmdB family regulatory protein